MPDRLFLEDFREGDVAEYGGVTVSAEDIVAFARQFDPQSFHLDDEAAKPVSGGLIASGWHAVALLLRMNCDAFLLRAAIAPGAESDPVSVEEIKWIRPIRPGDRLHVRRTALAARPAGARAEAGEVVFLFELVNQDGVVATSQRSALTLLRREPERADVL
jgi:acyl dehydratase